MNTIFIRWDGHRILCPNSKLSADLLTNVTRSQKKGESYRVRPTASVQHASFSLLVQSCSSANQSLKCVLSITVDNCLQILIDIGSDMGIFARMRDAVREHVRANPLDFTGESSVHANMGSDPLKLALNIWWSYCYNCKRSHAPP